MLFVLLLSLAWHDPPNELPTVDSLRKAFGRHADRLKNGRVKYIRVRQVGEPMNVFPPLDHPERVEYESTYSNYFFSNESAAWKERRLRHRDVWFRSGSQPHESITGWDGSKRTSLSAKSTPSGLIRTAEIQRHQPNPPSELFGMVELNTRHLAHQLGIRTSIQPSPHGEGLIELIPYRDDRSDSQVRYTLDAKKDFWPVRYDYESRAKGKEYKSRTEVTEFLSSRGGVYPKRLTYWRSSAHGGETIYYSVVSAEFPDKLSDADFAVVIPDGVGVVDEVEGVRYTQGSGEKMRLRVIHNAAPRSLWDEICEIPGEDWLFYGGFVTAITLFVGTSLFAFSRRRRKSDKPQQT